MYSVVLHGADETSTTRQNLADLIVQSERILTATVGDVSDGFTEQGVPYTEIELQVSESLKGGTTGEYTFRQFGLLKPRKMANEFNNLGLFDGVDINSALLSAEQQNMMTTPGAVDAAMFMDLVGRAVSEDWIAKGEMK
jgi:hypothetical protein